uniref:MetQ/NlpA family ABC transporter substrate-binding protein n=1 Tax=Vaginimicrobium propionicum TaxID=1871034 RepID=UPI0009707C9A|nr:MetQ/NlpA family ABC transporter substrate-binding protein [Vaginimicrobium propionicum]
MKKSLKIAAGLAAAALLLTGCSKSSETNERTWEKTDDGLTIVTVGATPTPHGEILAYIQETQAKEAGLSINVKEFNDYKQPNAALDSGSLDANYFQHQPYLDDAVDQFGYKIETLTPVHLEPLGVYSQKVKSLKDLPEGAKIGVPNDPTNEGRALRLLVDEGLIELENPDDLNATPINISRNDKKLEIVELEAPQVARSLPDLDAAVINSNFALVNGLDPINDTIATERADDNPYANVLVVRSEDKNEGPLKKLAELLCSTQTQDWITQKYQGSVVPACK